MMHVHLIAIGKLAQGPEQSLIDQYSARMPWSFTVTEIDIRKPARDTALRKKQEAERLLAAVPKSAIILALDERGKQLTSRAFARHIDTWMVEGYRNVALLVGGADGLDADVRNIARLVMGLGTLTWPHMLVRVMLAEQTYRAWSILSGHPYHRD